MSPRPSRVALVAVLATLSLAAPAAATPVCTDGYMGGPPTSACGGRVFPEAAMARSYVQFTSQPGTGFNEYRHGMEFLGQKYARWISNTTLAKTYGKQAVSAGNDKKRSYEAGDTGDGRDIDVLKVTDHTVPDAGKRTIFFSLSVHGNERGGLEGGLRTAEDLAMAATAGGKIADGVDNYVSTTGRKPVFHEYEVRELLAKMIVYFVDFNPDGWAVGDLYTIPTNAFARGNGIGTDLNRQMPTIGRIDNSRTPLKESEMRFGKQLMDEVAAQGRGGLMEYGADIHGELTSQAFMDIMYPAGQFDSVDHRRLMAIAERTKSVIDATLYEGVVDLIENADGGNEAEGSGKDGTTGLASLPTKPAHWGTVWDTLGYTDTGFIGDYLATETAVTGMDYEIFLNHTVPDKTWNVALQENHINATRGIIKTAMAYSMTQESEFSPANVRLDPKGRPGYVVNPVTVNDKDANGSGTKPGTNGKGADGQPVVQAPYDVTNQQWFADTDRLLKTPFVPIAAADVAAGPATLDLVDSLVLADVPVPDDAKGRPVDRAAYVAQLKAWVERGGNLVLTDKALHLLVDLGLLKKADVKDIAVYQPYANFVDFKHPLAEGLRSNARQLVEAPALGYEIGNDASPMTIVTRSAFESAGGKTVATTGNNSGSSDAGTQTSVGELKLGKGLIRIAGGALPMPTEKNDHRFGLRDYALTYTGLFIMENAIEHDAPGLGEGALPTTAVPKPGRSCLSRRLFTIRVPKPGRKQGQTRRATIKVNGRRVKVRRSRSGRLIAVVDLRKLRDRAKVEIVQTTSKGKRLKQTRSYRLCVKKGR